MTGIREVRAALFVDLGEGREIKKGDRASQIRWDRLPRARYECLRCQTTEGPVAGPAKVAKFVATIQSAHICRSRNQPQAA
ncbi:MAG TPA: hypothetical protein VIU15_39820 [Streptomyces sp.]